MNEKELGRIVAMDSMKRNIKKLGQAETLNIINTAIAKSQRDVYKQLFFKAVHELEV